VKRLAFIVTFLVGSVGAFQWISQGFSTSWEPRLRTYLEDVAGRLTHTRVHIDSIAPSFFHHVRLVNVRVTEPEDPAHPLFQAADIELTVSLIDLPRALIHRKAYEAIGLVTLRNPWVRLSAEILAKHKSYRNATASASPASTSLPPWFTLAWNSGTFQWIDAQAPHGSWTLYQAEGAFRIRGPRQNFAIRGSTLDAGVARFQFSSLGHRWNAQLMASDGECQKVISSLETLLKRPLLPKGVSLRGYFHLDVQASGRSWPTKDEDPRRYLDQATLTFLPSEKNKSDSLSIGLSGSLIYKKDKISASHFSFDGPGLEGSGNAELLIEGTRIHPSFTLKADLPSGQLFHRPFQNAVVQARYSDRHWDIIQNTFHFLEGIVSLKGSLASESRDLTITVENASLAALGQEHGLHLPDGRINVSGSLKGPAGQWDASGSWWLSGMRWGQNDVGEARGDFDITPEQFQAEAKSDTSRFRFELDGIRNEKLFEVDRFELDLPSGASLTADGHLNHVSGRLHGTFTAAHVDFPADVPFSAVDRIPVNGLVDGQAKLSGTLDKPILVGTLQSAGLALKDQSLGKTNVAFVWDKSHLDIPSFHIEPGVQGSYMQGIGLLKIKNKTIGRWTLSEGSLRFEKAAGSIHIQDFYLQTPEAILSGTGKAVWPLEESPPKKMALEARGNLRSAADAEAWTIPFSALGDMESLEKGWQGKVKVLAPRPLLRKKIMEPLETVVHWAPEEIHWTDTHWGHQWNSEGSLRWDKNAAAWSARVQANHVLLEEWQALLWPQGKEELRGTLSGDWNLTGTQEHPMADMSLHLEDAAWRAFHFSSDMHGSWSPAGIKPLTINGHLKTGGDFKFSGLLTSDRHAQGTVQLTGFNLRPLGDSLHFPKSLDGLVNATLTLSGPLDHLLWTGHVEGEPVIYAPESDHPFKLEQVAMDMTLKSLDSDSTVAHLTLTEGHAKTAEELIRFRPGSFVEFAGQKPAKLSLGTEIRNLHLGIFTLFGGLDLDGTWQIKPQGFAIQTQAQTHSLFINDYELGEGLVLADYYNGVLQFPKPLNAPPLISGIIDFHSAPQLKFTNFFISGQDQQKLELSGDVGPALWDFQMAGRGLDMAILGELAGFTYPLSGSANVQVHGTGNPKSPHVDGKVDLDHGAVMGLSFRSGSAAFIWQDARITFTKLELSDPGHYHLEGSGSFPLISKEKTTAQDHSIDFSVRLRDSNLSLLQSFSHEVKDAKGPVEGLLQIKGTLEDPDLRGSLRITNGNIVGAHYFRELRNANLDVSFEGDTIKIHEARGKSGEGEFKGAGSITLAGFVPASYDIQLDVISAKGLDVQVPELAIPESPLAKRFKFLTTASHTDVRGHVALRGPAEAPVFSGEGLFTNGHFTFPPSHKNPPSPALLEWFRRITWDVNLKFQDGAWFENELVQTNITGSLALKGPSDKLRVDGGLEINEGKISYLGLQFDIQQAHFDIRSEKSGDSIINTPYVRGAAECQIQSVDTVSGVAGASGGSRLSINDTITLNIDYAPIDEIKPRLTSAADPTLSQEKLLARVTQTDIENLTPQERTYLYQKQIVSMIDSSLATPLAQNVLKKTGLADRLRVEQVFDPNNSAPQDLNTTAATQQQSTAVNLFANKKYTVEKDLSNRLSLGYGVRFVATTAPELDVQQQKLDLISDVQLSYRWFRNVYLRGDFDLPTSNPNILPERKVTIEPRWRFGWWGNTNPEKDKTKSTP